jgi:MFS family permease
MASSVATPSRWPRALVPLRRKAFGILIGGYALSAVGDGMAMVAVPWLAISVAGGQDTGLIVGGAVAAYYLPGVAAWLLLGRFFAGWDGRKLVLAEAVLRAGALGAVAELAWAGALGPMLYIALLGVSSLFGLLGAAGDLAAVVELLPDDEQLAGNALVTMAGYGASIIGPAIAGGVIAVAGASSAIGVDAASFLLLAGAAVVSRRFQPPPPEPPTTHAGVLATLRSLATLPSVLGITALCVFFFGVYGPVEVALPVYVADDLGAGAGVLGGFWTLFSIGAILGALAASQIERFGIWRVVVGSVLGWGICLVPLGFADSAVVGFVALAVGGLAYGPFVPLKRAIIQRDTPAANLTAVAAATGVFTVLASPLGTAVGGPLVAAVGARATLTGSGVLTIVIAGVAAVVLVVRRKKLSESAGGSRTSRAGRLGGRRGPRRSRRPAYRPPTPSPRGRSEEKCASPSR